VDSVPYDAFAPNPVTRDGKTLMPPPKGSIARGQQVLHYGPGPDEAARAGRELSNPVPRSEAALARGGDVYASMCSHCHGPGGLGDGKVIPAFPTPPSLLAEHAKALPDGHLFHVISRGQGVMPAHAAQVQPEDRWKVIHYLRSLQAPREGT
ncbi:MAG: c-type cytochrome, partial [Myxococcales bacterium]